MPENSTTAIYGDEAGVWHAVPDGERHRAPRPKIIHRGDKIRLDGAVSARCFASARAIDLKRATWTLRDDAVTCPKCIRIQWLARTR
jgi:hypothetical protein